MREVFEYEHDQVPETAHRTEGARVQYRDALTVRVIWGGGWGEFPVTPWAHQSAMVHENGPAIPVRFRVDSGHNEQHESGRHGDTV